MSKTHMLKYQTWPKNSGFILWKPSLELECILKYLGMQTKAFQFIFHCWNGIELSLFKLTHKFLLLYYNGRWWLGHCPKIPVQISLMPGFPALTMLENLSLHFCPHNKITFKSHELYWNTSNFDIIVCFSKLELHWISFKPALRNIDILITTQGALMVKTLG